VLLSGHEIDLKLTEHQPGEIQFSDRLSSHQSEITSAVHHAHCVDDRATSVAVSAVAVVCVDDPCEFTSRLPHPNEEFIELVSGEFLNGKPEALPAHPAAVVIRSGDTQWGDGVECRVWQGPRNQPIEASMGERMGERGARHERQCAGEGGCGEGVWVRLRV
jgi:hypothetical protein